MVISNSLIRTYLFRSKVARIRNKSFQCCVSTAKESLFQKESTVILEPKTGNTLGAGATGLRPCGKAVYSPTLRTSDRFQFHDVIAKTLDEFGEEGCALEQALEQIFMDLKRRGIVVETLNLAADEGHTDAQFSFGDEFAKEAVWCRTRAEQDDAEAQYKLAYFYSRGKGVPEDDAKAAFWNRKAAEQGHVMAQQMLGYTYRYGLGVPENYAEALFWFDLAAAGELDASTAKINTENRDDVASHLTPGDVASVQEKLRKWFEAHPPKPQ